MATYTVSVTGPGSLAPRFEQLLDALPAAAMEGSEETRVATLWFDVTARDGTQAVERAHSRIAGLLRSTALDLPLTFAVARSSTIEGRRPWWRRLLTTF